MTRLVIISDTHTHNWMKELPHKRKIAIFGNHEVGFEHGYKRNPAIKMIKDAGIDYLEDSGVEIDGIKYWGSPVQPWFHSWEFNKHRGKEIRTYWDKIDPLTNVLITHGPPYGILDEVPRGIHGVEHVGCEDLLRRIDELKQLKIHCFGHCHRDHNEAPVERDGVMFCNASILNNQYKLSNDPIIIDL